MDIYSSITSSKNEASCPTAGFWQVGVDLFIPSPGLEPGSSGGKEASEPNRRFTVGFLMFLV